MLIVSTYHASIFQGLVVLEYCGLATGKCAVPLVYLKLLKVDGAFGSHNYKNTVLSNLAGLSLISNRARLATSFKV
jgi:hypothetical protein